MKTFSHLIEEVQKPGLCHHCGGCVTFCTAINYGALELAEDGAPRYKDPAKVYRMRALLLHLPRNQRTG